MRKSTLFISAALTTFMLAVMFGVASAYQKIVQMGVPTENAQQAQPTDVMVVAPATATNAATATMTLEEAATLASSVIGRTDLYAAENTQLDGVDVYMVTFSSGDLVYIGLDGKVVSISKIPVKYVLGQAISQGNSGGGGGGSSNSAPSAPSAPSSDSSDDHGDDHDGGDDDDD